MFSPAILLIIGGLTVISVGALISLALAMTEAPQGSEVSRRVGDEVDAILARTSVKLDVKASPGQIIYEWSSDDTDLLGEVASVGLHMMQTQEALLTKQPAGQRHARKAS